MSSSLGLAVPLVTAGISSLTNINITPAIEIGVILVITIVYIIMAYVGTEKGMKLVSNTTTIVCICFLIFILFSGPTSFILKNIINSLGFMIQNSSRMALFTDPINNSGFPEVWTIYFEAFYLNYVAMMGVFIAKISKGRTIREMAFATLLGISIGGWILVGINGSFSMKIHLDGIVDVVKLATSGIGEVAIYEIIKSLPLGATILPIIMILLVIGFVAPSLDSASLALTETVTISGKPKKFIRLFWCIVLSIIPMSIILTKSDFQAIKHLSIIVSIPFLFILCFIEIGLYRWLKKDLTEIR